MKRLVLLSAVAVFSSLFLAGCGSGACGSVCEAVFECSDSGLDVEDCERECQDANDRSESHENRVVACAECIGDRTCAEKAEFCGAECRDIDGLDED